jgi:hypothetical protein
MDIMNGFPALLALALFTFACDRTSSTTASSASASAPSAAASGSAMPIPYNVVVPPADTLAVDADTSGKCDEARLGGKAAPTLTSKASGNDLKVTVTDLVDYCASNAKFHVTRDRATIHVVREKPTTVSRCACVRASTSFTVHGVAPGSYKVVYEEIPYASDAATATTIASGTATMN